MWALDQTLNTIAMKTFKSKNEIYKCKYPAVLPASILPCLLTDFKEFMHHIFNEFQFNLIKILWLTLDSYYFFQLKTLLWLSNIKRKMCA